MTSPASRSRFRLPLGHWLRLARDELGLLAIILIVASGLLAFAWIADEVLEGETNAFDRRVLLACRNPSDVGDPIGPRWFEEMSRDITALGGVAVLVMVSMGIVGLLLMLRRQRAAILVVIAVGGGLLVSTVLKNSFDRARPDLVPHGSYVVTSSFPSGHAMLSAVAYLTLGALLARSLPKRAQKAYVVCTAVFLTLLIGMSRIYLGVHWPTDVLAGWCVGATWAMLCWLVDLWLQRRGQVESDKQPMMQAEDRG